MQQTALTGPKASSIDDQGVDFTRRIPAALVGGGGTARNKHEALLTSAYKPWFSTEFD